MGFIRDRIAARHQSSCQPCDSQPHFVQSPCAPQPLVYSTPYATMGGCQPCQVVPTADRCTIPAMPAMTITDSAGLADERKTQAPGNPRTGRDRDVPPRAPREEKELPPLPRLRALEKPALPGLTVEDLYKFDGVRPATPGIRPDAPTDRPAATDRSRQLERELRIARDEIDNLKKQIEQLRADQRALIEKMQQGIRPAQQQPFVPQQVPPPVQQQPFVPQQVPPPVQQQPFVPQQVPPPVQQQPFVPQQVPRPVQQPQPGKPPYAVPPVGDIQPPPGQPAAPNVRPWEVQPAQPVAPPGKVQPEVKQPVVPPALPQPEVKQPVVPPALPQPEVKQPAIAPPPVPVPSQQFKPEVPKINPTQPNLQPVVPSLQPGKAEVQKVPQPVGVTPPVLAPGQPGQPGKPVNPIGKPNDDFVQKAVADSKRLVAAEKDRKFEDIKAPFERFMQGERERLTRAMDNNSKDHPEMMPAKTSWLLAQEAEKLIKDVGYKKKVDDVTWYFGSSAVINDENAVRDERVKQWEQVRLNACNKDDPNYEKKQGVLNEIMNGWHLTEGRKFGRMNDKRGDSPLSNNKLQWQIDAAEALVRVNSTNGISHDFSTRAIVRGLVGDVNGHNVNLPVPEQARIKLLDAIVPMSKESGNPFLGANPKDTALGTVITALERSHASRRPESDFQIAAINKLVELDDVRGITILQKLAAESSSTQVRELAAKKAEALREKIKP
ncbi:MAG: hypothetical protein EKK48_02690 [Candidatus Melainabacteria bacterium]|nr:MAG: hypothetical protein EKK48_02690 [Candidatus Melainabacteria bacterium]